MPCGETLKRMFFFIAVAVTSPKTLVRWKETGVREGGNWTKIFIVLRKIYFVHFLLARQLSAPDWIFSSGTSKYKSNYSRNCKPLPKISFLISSYGTLYPFKRGRRRLRLHGLLYYFSMRPKNSEEFKRDFWKK